MADEKDHVLAPLEQLLVALESIPDVDRGIHWESRSGSSGQERLQVWGQTASALKLVLDGTDAIKAALRQTEQIKRSFERIRYNNVNRFFGTIKLMLERAAETVAFQKRERELLEANNRYLEEARAARRELATLRESTAKIDAVVIKFDQALSQRFDDFMKQPSAIPYDERISRRRDEMARFPGKKVVLESSPEFDGAIEVITNLGGSPAPSAYSARELRNIFAVLDSIDRHEIEEAGYDMPDGSWDHFQKDPRGRFLECNDECREAIVKVLNRRIGEK